MRVEISTFLPCPPERVWLEIQKPKLMRHVSAPVLTFVPLQPTTLPERWSEGKYLVAMRLFGVVPLGTQWIGIESPPGPRLPGRFTLRDNGRGQLISTWDHHVIIEPEGGGTRYTDEVGIDAGWRTPFVWAFASLFYRHRQRRWRRFVRNGMNYG